MEKQLIIETLLRAKNEIQRLAERKDYLEGQMHVFNSMVAIHTGRNQQSVFTCGGLGGQLNIDDVVEKLIKEAEVEKKEAELKTSS